MCDVLIADFVEADATYDENTEYRYLLNVVSLTLEQWLLLEYTFHAKVVRHIRLPFRKLFYICKAKLFSL